MTNLGCAGVDVMRHEEFFDKVVDVLVVLCNGVLRVQKTVEVIQLVPQERIQGRITEQVADVPLPHIMEEMVEVHEKFLAKSLFLA